MTVFDYLKASLAERRWSIPYFARECGVSNQLAYKWLAEDEFSRITPSPASCEKIAEALGVDVDYVLELAGHRNPRQPTRQIDAKRQAVRDQLDRWLTAVGPVYESYFWQNLKAHGDATAELIQELTTAAGTAVSGGAKSAVNSVVSAPAVGRRRRRRNPRGPLTSLQHGVERRIGRGRRRTDWPLMTPGDVTIPTQTAGDRS